MDNWMTFCRFSDKRSTHYGYFMVNGQIGMWFMGKYGKLNYIIFVFYLCCFVCCNKMYKLHYSEISKLVKNYLKMLKTA